MSKWSNIVLSLVSAMVGSAVVLGAAVALVVNSDTYKSLKPNPYGAGVGHEMLVNFQCRIGETKHIFLNGIDDDFAITGVEPSRKSGRYDNYPGHIVNSDYHRAYDEKGHDKGFFDFFDLPSHIVKGVFVMRLEPKDEYGSDMIYFGDMGSPLPNGMYADRSMFSVQLNDWHTQLGWAKHGDIYTARLKDISLTDPKYKKYQNGENLFVRDKIGTMLSYLQDRKNKPFIEIMIGDDTAVDFTGMAVCTMPEAELGMTFSEVKAMRTITDEFLVLSCNMELSEKHCNPFYGDMSCGTPLPLACIKDEAEDFPTPPDRVPDVNANMSLWGEIKEHWSGGRIDFTSAIPGGQFETLKDADQYCAAQFGENWRVLSFHDGGFTTVAGRVNSQFPKGRVWIDIKDQPHATCWAHDGVAP